MSRAASGSRRTRQGTHDLCSAFLAAVGYVVDLAAWGEDAHFHERFASGALRRMGLKARFGFSCCDNLLPLNLRAGAVQVADFTIKGYDVWSTPICTASGAEIDWEHYRCSAQAS